MSIKETIRAEIERRRNEWLAKSRLIKKGRDVAMYAAGKSSAYAEFLSLLDTLPEQPVEVLEEAAEEYANKEYPNEPAVGQWGTGDYEPPIDMEYPREVAKDAFIAGAEWMAYYADRNKPKK